jgi:transcriptional antiterminator/mannitol/fructose-specific phosphotransferase system IIA component (Ntr-type)
MILKERQVQMIKEILKNTDKIDTLFLKDKFSISERTVRNDLKDIDGYLESEGLPKLSRSKKLGISMDVSDIVKDQLVQKLKLVDDSEYVLSPEERMHAILLFLLTAKERTSVQEIADRLDFSKNTLVEDVKRLDKYLDTKSCSISKKRKLGMKLEASEFQKRQLYIELFIKHFNIGKWAIVSGKLKDIGSDFHMVLQKELEELLRHWNMEKLISFTDNLQKKLKLRYTDSSLNTLILAVVLSNHRYKNGCEIELPLFQVQTIKLSQEYKALEESLDESFNWFENSSHERAFIAMYMLSNKILEQEEGSVFSASLEDLKETTQTMIRVFEEDQNINLDVKEREKLLKGLMLHLEPASYRMRYNIAITNPMLSAIKDKYRDYYDSASKACMHLSQRLHLIVPEEEVAYVAIYFGGIMESRRQKSLKVMLVCNAGMATVRILETRLLEEFQDIDIIGHQSYSEFRKKKWSDVDIIISTLDIDYRERPVVVVQPMLEEEDVLRLKRYFSQRVVKKTQSAKFSSDEIIDIVEKYATIHAKKPLKRAIESLMRGERKKDKKLSELLMPDHVVLNQSAENWREAVKLATSRLIFSGDIQRSYEEAIIKNIERLKAYVVIKPQVALPHAKPKDGVNKLAMSFVSLEKGVNFGHSNNDPVRLIVVLASDNSSSHLKALDTLIRIIKDPKRVDELIEANTYDEIISIIKAEEENEI